MFRKHINYNDLTAFEAVAMSAVAVMAVLAGVATALSTIPA